MVLTSKDSIQNVIKKKKNRTNEKNPSRLKAPITETCHLLEEKREVLGDARFH